MEIDRLSVRSRPSGRPIMYQTWDRLLFMHWRIPQEQLRPLIPDALQIDTYDGSAWIGMTPFTMPKVRPRGLPAVPVVSSSHELNVRTYVHHEGVPGVWFLSLDASNLLAVLGARAGFGLPYYAAQMTLQEWEGTIRFMTQRRHPEAPPARLAVTWQRGQQRPRAEPGTLDFFLIERYCLYAQYGGRLLRTRIFHEPWPLCRATITDLSSSMLESHGLPTPEEEPVLHGQEAPLEVRVWAPSCATS